MQFDNMFFNYENTIRNLIRTFTKDNHLNNKINSVYAMGSFARRDPNFNDIDLNIFINGVDFHTIEIVQNIKSYLENNLKKSIDFNVIDMETIKNNMLNSDLFPHKNRHSLFLHEITTVKRVIYGCDVLADFKISYSDLISESLKIATSQLHRISKPLLMGKKGDLTTSSKKCAKYCLEFLLIFKGFLNPYVNMNHGKILEIYPELQSFSDIIAKIYTRGSFVSIQESYDLIDFISQLMRQRYYYLISVIFNNQLLKEKVSIYKKNIDFSKYYFVFPSIDEIEIFRRIHENIPNHKRLYQPIPQY